MRAARKGHVEVTWIHAERGADLNVREKSGSTPVMRAAKQGQVKVVLLLAERGADLNVNEKSGMIAVTRAAKQGQVEVVRLFAERGADLNVQLKVTVRARLPSREPCADLYTSVITRFARRTSPDSAFFIPV